MKKIVMEFEKNIVVSDAALQKLQDYLHKFAGKAGYTIKMYGNSDFVRQCDGKRPKG